MPAERRLPPYLTTLNPEQLEAVLHEGSPLLILAGAGTGKTRVITTKIAYLVKEKGIQPESILAVTFTNKAAREMRERAAILESRCERAVIRTFHSFGAWFLRRNAAAAGLDSNFVIYDDGDSSELIHAALPQLARQECKRYASLIARAKDYNLEPDSPNLNASIREEDFRRIYALYRDRLRSTGNVDFGDLIRLPTKILDEDEAIARRTRQRFRVILVDEYQDANTAQFLLLQRLAGPDTYICVVGDDDQSIYKFRGAEIKNILGFSKIFPGTKTIKLERNYRSYQTILDIAGNVVSHNSGRLGKTLRATKPGGGKPQLALLDDQDQEVEFCARIVRAHQKQGGSLSDIAILYRTNAQSLAFEKDFPRKGISYQLVGALRFYDREEVKDVLSYLSLILNPRDEIAFRRVINKPARGLGDTSVEAILNNAMRRGASVLDSCRDCGDSMRGKGKAGLEQFLAIMDHAASLIGDSRISGSDAAQRGEAEGDSGPYSLSDGGRANPDSGSSSLGILLEALIKESGLAGYHKGQDEIAGTQKLANMEELVNASSIYPLVREGLAEFLETIELDRGFQAGDQSETKEAVTLITMHNTKGLEFPIVIVTGLEQGLFPRDDEEGEDLEEQRRLFYVALTRAKDSLYLSACRWRRMRGRLFETSPSRFLTEMDPAMYEFWKSGSSASRPMAAHFPRSTPSLGAPGAGSRQGSPSGYNPMAGSYGGKVPRRPAVDAAPGGSEWRQGQSVYHDEYGQGSIIKVSMTESSGPLVIVQFESGKIAQFFPKYTRKLERIKE
ncbi:MAG TPA: UvrD-helicase domain-containing protein [Rectinemataceae bacterium]|nr:UvrD-helicase domain-containing protein [Rectinemataceae bacterium]